jgi:energy-coupling factor transporter ATP-binding protein EcfA2
MHAARLQGTRFLPALNGAELVGLTAVLATGYWLVSDGAITVGAATAAALYFHRAFDPVGELLFLFDDLQDALSSLGRLVGIAELPVPEDAPARAGTTVVARGLGHSYLTGHAVLDDVDLDIAPGEHVAVVGTSGAGKTTLARIVAGVLEPTRGDVRIGEGHPHASAALVAQEVHVFAGTLGDDLRLAAPDAEDAQLHAALARVGASWVDGLPHGLSTVVGIGGHPWTPHRRSSSPSRGSSCGIRASPSSTRRPPRPAAPARARSRRRPARRSPTARRSSSPTASRRRARPTASSSWSTAGSSSPAPTTSCWPRAVAMRCCGPPGSARGATCASAPLKLP